MKKFIQFAVIAILLFVCSAQASAWTVYASNGWAGTDLKIRVTGEHLFWRQVDCEIYLPASKGQEVVGSCNMPGAICPVGVEVTFINTSTKESTTVKCSDQGVPLRCMDIMVGTGSNIMEPRCYYQQKW